MQVEGGVRARALLKFGFLVAVLCLAVMPPGAARAAAPAVTAEAATELASTTVRAHGSVIPGPREAFYRFEYISDSLYDTNVVVGGEPFAGAISDGSGWLPPGAEAVPVAPLLGEVGGLEEGVEYHLRLVAENGEGLAVALAPNFTTPKLLEPIACFGDNCQVLPSEPHDPTLSTTIAGLGNPKVHYDRYGSKARPKSRKHRHGRHHSKKPHGKKTSNKAAK